MLHIFNDLSPYALYFCQMQRYIFKCALCTVTKTEELIHTLFGHDLRFIFDYIKQQKESLALSVYFLVVTCTY